MSTQSIFGKFYSKNSNFTCRICLNVCLCPYVWCVIHHILKKWHSSLTKWFCCRLSFPFSPLGHSVSINVIHASNLRLLFLSFSKPTTLLWWNSLQVYDYNCCSRFNVSYVTLMSSTSGPEWVRGSPYILYIEDVTGHHIKDIMALAGKMSSNWVWYLMSVGHNHVSMCTSLEWLLEEGWHNLAFGVCSSKPLMSKSFGLVLLAYVFCISSGVIALFPSRE